MIFIIFLNGEEEGKLLGIRKSVFSSWFVLTIGKPELINFNSQTHFRLFKRGRQFWGPLWDPSESDSLWGPPAGCRGEMTLPHWICQWLTAKGNTEWQTNKIPESNWLCFLISRVLCSNKFKSSSIYKFHPWSKVNQSTCGIWIPVPWEWFIVLEFSLCFCWGKQAAG